jgi:hypothetical protein
MTSRRLLIKSAGAIAAGFALRRPHLYYASPPPVAAAPAAPPAPPRRHGGSPLRGSEVTARDRRLSGRFGMMFKQLPPFAPADALLSRLAATMAESSGGGTALDNPRIPAGFTFLGQFIDHDLTFDQTPLSDQQVDPDALTNYRTARFDLDSVYGGGPLVSPELYDPADREKLLIAGLNDPTVPDDMPRRADGTAIVPESRNEENLIVCQIHVAFMKFHNALVDLVRSRGARFGVFELARQLTRWHYQWLIVHEFLPLIAGQETVDALIEDRPGGPPRVRLDHYRPTNPLRPMMPVEFSAAAYRFGHSKIRPFYRMNALAGASIFAAQPNEHDLNGFRPVPPALAIDFRFFYQIDSLLTPQAARRIDSRLSVPLFNLPASVVAPPDPHVSLAERNLLRGKRLGLPSGQSVAQAIGTAPLANRDLGLDDPAWGGQAPLWYYVLKEAELQQDGQRLGAVGARIVAEVIVGLMYSDPSSYLRLGAAFRPLAPVAQTPGQFGMAELLRFAGAV